MIQAIRKAVPILSATAALAGLFMVTPSQEVEASPFDTLLGTWRGSGTVRLKLDTRNGMPVVRMSNQSLYQESFATFEEDEVYTQSDAGGFIRLNALRLTIQALVDKKRK